MTQMGEIRTTALCKELSQRSGHLIVLHLGHLFNATHIPLTQHEMNTH